VGLALTLMPMFIAGGNGKHLSALCHGGDGALEDNR